MDPKMTAKDAAEFLGITAKQLTKELNKHKLAYNKTHNTIYFSYETSKRIFKLKVQPQVVALQIVKGGTGKTSLAAAIAVRANLYGLKVLCVDLDQQGNLTHNFGINAEKLPVMVDILAENYSFEQAITNIYPGLDLLSSRIENALINDVIKLKKLPLNKVYRTPLLELKSKYDLIVIDCPPNIGQSVAAVALAADKIIAPVVPENFALVGLKIACNTIRELESDYKIEIPLNIILNKYDARTILSQDALKLLSQHYIYSPKLLKTYVRASQEFPNAIAKGISIYDTVKPTIAKKDIDLVVRELLSIGQVPFVAAKVKFKDRISSLAIDF